MTRRHVGTVVVFLLLITSQTTAPAAGARGVERDPADCSRRSAMNEYALGSVQCDPPRMAHRAPRPKEKLDPQLIAKARELRDRYLEQVNDQPASLPAGGQVRRRPAPVRAATDAASEGGLTRGEDRS